MEINKTKISVDEVKPHTFKKDLNSAQLRQIIEKVYPSVRPNTGGLFDKKEFNLPEQIFQENRVTWIDVPTDKTQQDVEARLELYPDACIWRELSSELILTENDIAYGKTLSEDEAAEFIQKKTNQQQVISNDGEVILHENKPQYRRLFFSDVPHDDVDNRVKEYHTALPRLSLQPVEEQTQGVRTI